MAEVVDIEVRSMPTANRVHSPEVIILFFILSLSLAGENVR
jgi:hypothetical protein